jgi:hypothetical protein
MPWRLPILRSPSSRTAPVSEGTGCQRFWSSSFVEQVATVYPCDYASWEKVQKGLGILRAARGEIEFGPLPRLEQLVSGELFEDLLEMAQHLPVNLFSDL